MFLPIIISGGSGERLWPASREFFPKPFIVMPDGQSLIKKAFERAIGQDDVSEVVTVTNREHYFKTKSEYQMASDVVKTSYILEPMGRNTAPAIAMAASYAAAMHGDETILLILPADQLISDGEGFREAVEQARILAQQGKLVTFGITPSRAETGYGYIHFGAKSLAGTTRGYSVERFVEKPDKATAETYLRDGKHLWNAGIFCFMAGAFLRELAQHAPELLTAARRAMPADWSQAQTSYIELPEAEFAAIPSISIDYALMEKSKNVAVVACDIGWNDVGSWGAMSSLIPPDENGNRILGNVLTHEVSDCYIRASDRLIGALGVKDLIIIDTPDALLLAARESAHQVKQIVSQLKQRSDETSKQHRTVFRPWGTYSVLQESVGYKIKRIEVSPGQKLSLQRHKNRSEHWVVVAGRARVHNNGAVLELGPSESTYIPAGHKHRLENIGEDILLLVEVQCGDYLGEDDIERFDDSYGRTATAS